MQRSTIVLIASAGAMAIYILLRPQEALASETETCFNTFCSSSCYPTCEQLVTGEPSDMKPTCSNITADTNTWPTGDRVWDVCRAIALAEGANIEGSNPDKLNNPGDISDGMAQFSSQFHSGSMITNFPDKATGWSWLYNKITHHLEGKSVVYPAYWTITQFAQEYAADWQPWKTIVGNQLGVNPDTTRFADYVNGTV